MDIYRFFNSSDVANYLKEIGYGLTAAQAAYVVYACEHAMLAEKIEAWKSIISEMPDEKAPKAERYLGADTAHELIKLHISAEENKFTQFHNEENAVFFPYESRWSERPYWIPEEELANGLWNTMSMPVPFETFGECVEYLRGISGRQPDNWRYDRHVICRVDTGGWHDCYEYWDKIEPRNYPQNRVVLNGDFETMEVVWGWNEMPLDSVLPAIPTPFAPGDIVIDRTSRAPHPFVFCFTIPWTTESRDEVFDYELSNSSATLALLDAKGNPGRIRVDSERLIRLVDDWFKPEALVDYPCLTCYSGWQTVAFGYEVRPEYGELILDECGATRNYLNLEYYRGPLEGGLEILGAVSAYLKGNLSLEHVVNLSRIMALENIAIKTRRSFDDLLAYDFVDVLAKPAEGEVDI